MDLLRWPRIYVCRRCHNDADVEKGGGSNWAMSKLGMSVRRYRNCLNGKKRLEDVVDENLLRKLKTKTEDVKT